MYKLLIIVLLIVSVSASASQSPWLGSVKSQSSDTESRKTENGFSGMLLVTPDTDWEQKWNTPPDTIPHFRTTKAVRVGERLVILTFFVNPLPDENGNVNVICGIKAIRPDHSISINEKGISCLKGELRGAPKNVRLSPAIINFEGEKNDPLGEWIVEVEIEDVNRNTTLRLRTRFTLEASGG